MIKQVLFLTIQFSISYLFGRGLNISRTLTGDITLGQSGLWINGKERVLHITQSSNAGDSPSDCFVSYPGYSLRGR